MLFFVLCIASFQVKMPKRPSKKAMEAVFDELWAVENQTPDVTDEAEVIEEVEEGEEERSPSRVREGGTKRPISILCDIILRTTWFLLFFIFCFLSYSYSYTVS